MKTVYAVSRFPAPVARSGLDPAHHGQTSARPRRSARRREGLIVLQDGSDRRAAIRSR